MKPFGFAFLLLLLLGGAPLSAQEAGPAASAAETPVSRLEAVERVIDLLSDQESRAALVTDLERLRLSLVGRGEEGADAPRDEIVTGTIAPESAEAASAEEPAATEDAEKEPLLVEEGLLSAVTSGMAHLGETLPEAALGEPIGTKLDRALAQVGQRIAGGLESGAILGFFAWALPGWLLAGAAAAGLLALPWLRRQRRTRPRPRETGPLVRMVALKALLGFLPVLAAFAVLTLAALVLSPPIRQVEVFALVAAPVLIAFAAAQLIPTLLALLGPSRGWLLVAYARRRLTGWVAALVALAMTATALRDPVLRQIVGWDANDLVRLVLDLALAFTTLVFVLKHRALIRRLILKGHVTHDRTAATGIMQRVITAIGNYWHILAILFITANVVARLLGIGDGSFIVQATLAVLVFTGGLLVATLTDNALARLTARRSPTGARQAILARHLELLRIVVQAAIFAAVVFASLDLWGLDLDGWFATDAGWDVARPILSMASALLLSWIIWITLDAWIAAALAPTDHRGRARQQSSRAKTLLPLVRNFVFITLIVLTGIAVLANIGFNVAPLLAGAGVIGLAVGFGSQQLVQDVITGLFILFEDTISIGDVVDTGDRAGTVEGLTIRTLRLRDADGALHSIPFSSVKALKNSSRGFGVYTVNLSVGYAADVDEVIDVMREIGAEIARDPQHAGKILIPFELWGVDQFTPEGIVIKGAIRTTPLQQWGVGREFNRRLKKRLDAIGVDLAPRHLTVFSAAQEDRRPEPAAG